MTEKTLKERVDKLEQRMKEIETAIAEQFKLIPNMELGMYNPGGVPPVDKDSDG